MRKTLKAFLFPELNRKYLLRLGLVALGGFVLFGLVLRPYRIKGHSMDPTYRDGTFLLCFRQRFLLSRPKRGDVVMVKLGGIRVMYLKRVVALPGQTVEFRDGTLYVDGQAQVEPWITSPCNWNLEPRTVDPGFLYVVGDNRSMDISGHEFGAVLEKRIEGGPLW